MRSIYIALTLSLAATAPRAEVPAVVTDILPVHGLVSAVLGDLGSPHLLIRPGEDPHHGGLRPSDANALSKADLMIWIGPELTPWLSKGVETLAASSRSIELMELPDTRQLDLREDGHGDEEDHDDHADHDDHDDHKHDEEHAEPDDHMHDEEHAEHDDHMHDEEHADHDDHEHDEEHADHDDHDDHAEHDDHAGHDDHNHGDHDPHVWLDPANASLWLTIVADALSEIDPENAATYQANAAAETKAIAELVDSEKAELGALESRSFLTTHDSYQYFESVFGLAMRGAVSDSDNQKPGPARLAEIMELADTAETRCLAHDLVTPRALVETLQNDTDLIPVEVDPLGAKLTAGPDHYRSLIKDVSSAFQICLSQSNG